MANFQSSADSCPQLFTVFLEVHPICHIFLYLLCQFPLLLVLRILLYASVLTVAAFVIL